MEKSKLKTYLKEANKLTKIMMNQTNGVEPGAMLSPLRGPLVYVCIRTLKPFVMIETGVASGSSTYYILQAMELNRKDVLYSIDLSNADQGSPVPNGEEIGWLVPSKLRQRWKLVLGRSQEKLPALLD